MMLSCHLFLALFFVLCASESAKKPIDLTNIATCKDVDELPAHAPNETWASLYEVISPYQMLCKVPVPETYTTRQPWPACLWELPTGNVPKAPQWESGHIKSSQKWIKVTLDKIQLPRGGGSLAASKFLDLMPKSIDMSQIKTVLDEGAGVCGLAAEIMATQSHHPVVLSYAPHDTHTNQVQLCMERGVPAIIFSMARYQFPVPPGSFDMVTCKWCWHWIGAVSMAQWFLEVDRVLKPGGYFVIFASVWQTLTFKDHVEDWSKALGWEKVKGAGKDMAAFRKPSEDLPTPKPPSLICPEDEALQPSFRRLHVPCRYPTIAPSPPPAEKYMSLEEAYVKKILSFIPKSSSFINILDASSYNGTFGSAIKEQIPNSWTLNIQPVASAEFHIRSTGGFSLNYAGLANYIQAVPYDGLRSVFAQGQVGLYHDWCYMFPNYPRVFDFIHVRDLHVSHQSCLTQIVLEMDRLLRPGGYIVLCGDGVGSLLADELKEAGSVLGWELVGEGKANLPRGGDPASFKVLRKMGGKFTKSVEEA